MGRSKPSEETFHSVTLRERMFFYTHPMYACTCIPLKLPLIFRLEDRLRLIANSLLAEFRSYSMLGESTVKDNEYPGISERLLLGY